MNGKRLCNTYYLMRHGHSLANEKGLIISDPLTGIKDYGLSEQGKEQVRNSSKSFQGAKECIIYSSDFLRTAETAEIFLKENKSSSLYFTESLRERFFGDYEGKSNLYYEEIWNRDLNNSENNYRSVECPSGVAARTQKLIIEIETAFKGRDVVLISHGDCLQILLTVLLNRKPSEHRSLPHFQVAEIRKVLQ